MSYIRLADNPDLIRTDYVADKTGWWGTAQEYRDRLNADPENTLPAIASSTDKSTIIRIAEDNRNARLD